MLATDGDTLKVKNETPTFAISAKFGQNHCKLLVKNKNKFISHISEYIGRYQISIEQRVAVTVRVYRLVRSTCTTVQNLISHHILSDICHPKGGESNEGIIFL
jgi:hypothetical protein